LLKKLKKKRSIKSIKKKALLSDKNKVFYNDPSLRGAFEEVIF
jgi:hypothetical protein